MSRVFQALKADLRFQLKQGFYTIYLAISVLYIVVLYCFPMELRRIIAPLCAFSDPAIVGMLFTGAQLMLEKSQGVLSYIAITPLAPREYIGAKVLSFGIFGSVMTLLIALTTIGFHFNLFYYLAGIVLTSTMFTSVGVIVGVKSRSMNEFIVKLTLPLIIFTLPCLGIIGFKYSLILEIFPSLPALEVVFAAFNSLAPLKVIMYLLYVLLWDIFLIKEAVASFAGYLVLKGENAG